MDSAHLGAGRGVAWILARSRKEAFSLASFFATENASPKHVNESSDFARVLSYFRILEIFQHTTKSAPYCQLLYEFTEGWCPCTSSSGPLRQGVQNRRRRLRRDFEAHEVELAETKPSQRFSRKTAVKNAGIGRLMEELKARDREVVPLLYVVPGLALKPILGIGVILQFAT